MGVYSLREASFTLANAPFFPAFFSLLTNKSTSPVAQKEVQGKAMASLVLFVSLWVSTWLFDALQENQWNVSKDHRMLISNKQWIITAITVIPLMAIIININLSSETHDCPKGGYDLGVTRPCCGHFLSQREVLKPLSLAHNRT